MIYLLAILKKLLEIPVIFQSHQKFTGCFTILPMSGQKKNNRERKWNTHFMKNCHCWFLEPLWTTGAGKFVVCPLLPFKGHFGVCYLMGSLKFSISLFLWPVKYTEKILKSAGFHNVLWTEFGPLISSPQESSGCLPKNIRELQIATIRWRCVALAGCTCCNALYKTPSAPPCPAQSWAGPQNLPKAVFNHVQHPVRFCTQKLCALGTYFSECLRAARREGKVNSEALIWFITVCPLKDESRWQSQRLWWVLQMEWIPKVPLSMFLKMLIWSSYPCPSILSLFMRQFTRKR